MRGRRGARTQSRSVRVNLNGSTYSERCDRNGYHHRRILYRDRPARAHPARGRREHIVLPVVVRGVRAALGACDGYAVNRLHSPHNVPSSVLPSDRRPRISIQTGRSNWSEMTFGVRHRFLEYNRLPISQVRNTDKPHLRFFTDVREALPISAINAAVFADPSQLLVSRYFGN